jgi:hypothetical protein
MVRRPQPAHVRLGVADGPAVCSAHRPVRRGRRRAWPREDSEEPQGAAPGEGVPLSAVASGGARAWTPKGPAHERGARDIAAQSAG